jgi:hypothetical protein
MTTVDLYFQTISRADFLADLLALQLASEIHGSGGAQILPVGGVELDYVGQLIQTPAVFDTGVFPPTITTPAVFYPGERANLRLTGPDAEAHALVIAAATLAHSTLLAPADVPAGQMRWAGGGEPWDGQASVPVPPPSPEVDLATQKTRLLARLAQRRWEVETGGITINGAQILTDRESTAMLAGALQLLGLSPEGATVKWKAATGFISLDLPSLQAIALAVGQHVQACFAREATLTADIASAPDADSLTPISAAIEGFTP